MNDPHELYIDLRKTDRLIAEWRHQLDCQYRMIATLRRQRALAWREKLRAREMENRIAALSAHRDALIRTAAARSLAAPHADVGDAAAVTHGAALETSAEPKSAGPAGSK